MALGLICILRCSFVSGRVWKLQLGFEIAPESVEAIMEVYAIYHLFGSG